MQIIYALCVPLVRTLTYPCQNPDREGDHGHASKIQGDRAQMAKNEGPEHATSHAPYSSSQFL